MGCENIIIRTAKHTLVSPDSLTFKPLPTQHNVAKLSSVISLV